MLFGINQTTGSLEHLRTNWEPKELELEKYLIIQTDEQVPILKESVFGEPLLLVSNQVKTRVKKRADILALDRAGNSVIIELKRNEGRLGVETQALQYLADFSKHRGKDFVRHFCESNSLSEDTILGFLGDKTRIEDINSRSRVILVARSFDETIFSIGEWLSSKGVSFRCIAYQPAQIEDTKLLSFSVVFDRSPESLYSLSFTENAREPGIFWHNIGRANQAWWDFSVSHGQISAGFDNSPGDQGERLLTRYISGDKIVAYAKGYGAIGWGCIEDPKYQLIKSGDKHDFWRGDHMHRVNISWKAVAQNLSDGLKSEDIRRDFRIYHPVSTSVSMNTQAGNQLIQRLSERFGEYRK